MEPKLTWQECAGDVFQGTLQTAEGLILFHDVRAQDREVFEDAALVVEKRMTLPEAHEALAATGLERIEVQGRMSYRVARTDELLPEETPAEPPPAEQANPKKPKAPTPS
jgi:hypothetical protein